MAQQAKPLQLNRPNQPQPLVWVRSFLHSCTSANHYLSYRVPVYNIRIQYKYWEGATDSSDEGLRLSRSVSLGF
jgi:hypothetical protein